MADDFSGKWHNELGSWMELKVDPQGIVTGRYSTAVGEPTPSDLFDLRGIVSGDLLSFIVHWKNASVDYASITAWVGQMTKDDDSITDRIETLWHLARNVPDDEKRRSSGEPCKRAQTDSDAIHFPTSAICSGRQDAPGLSLSRSQERSVGLQAESRPHLERAIRHTSS